MKLRRLFGQCKLRRHCVITAVFAFSAISGSAIGENNASLDDTARLLAGLPVNGPLSAFTQDQRWQEHAAAMDKAWKTKEYFQLGPIASWMSSHAGEYYRSTGTMYYMFSGPDFLYANAFYSKATTYVLSALEPPGSVPDLSRMPRGAVAGALNSVERSLSSVLNFSFFITKQMKADLHGNQVSGTLPLLYVFLARSGKAIRNVTPVALDSNGGVHLPGEDAGANATHGIRITFTGDDALEKTLYYFSTDLSNSGVNASGFLKFCATLAPGNSLLKSASYLLHSSGFSTVRTFILANSATIIQDDSGIPLGNYSQTKWRFFPFGRYAGPIEKFPGKYQERYAELFRRAQPIDFGIGYRWRTYETNLLLSVRLNPDEPLTAADTTSSVEPPAERPQRPRAPRPPGLIGPQRGGGFFWFPWGR
jgi:hypothetical protein